MSFKVGYLNYLKVVAEDDVAHLIEKEKSYGDSWKKRGGIGAFMVFARKWDRIENMLGKDSAAGSYDIFSHIEYDPSGKDSTVLAELRDLRRYLMLVEAEMMARNVVPVAPREHNRPGTPEDGGHHSKYVDGQVNSEPTIMDGQKRYAQTPSCSGDTR